MSHGSIIQESQPGYVPRNRARYIGAFLVLTGSLLCLAFGQRHLTWDDDGFSYTRMMLEDAGKPPAEALQIAETYYRASPIGHLPYYGKFYSVSFRDSPQAAGPIFRSRILYPWLGARLYPQRGLLALVDISMIAYIIAALALYYLILAVARPLFAVLFTLPLCLSPEMAASAKAPITDMLGLAFWVIALACCFHYLRTRRRAYIALFALVCLLMALTRPMLYLPLGASAGLAIASGLHRHRSNMFAGVVLFAIAAIAATAQLFLVRAVQGAPLLWAIHVVHKNAVERGVISRAESISSWYDRTVLGMLLTEAKRSLKTILPGLAIIAAFLNRDLDETGLLIGAGIVSLIPILLDPNPYDLARLVEAPMYPVVLVAMATTVERVVKRSLGGPRNQVLVSAGQSAG